MGALPSLVYIHRYGDVRNTEIGMVNALIHEIIPRICVSLPPSCVSLDDEASQQVFDHLLSVNKALLLLDDEAHLSLWIEMLERIAQNETIHGQICGAATRILLDSEQWSIFIVADVMTFALSPSVEVAVAGAWLQGFLHGSGLLLIHNPSLWEIVDNWVSALRDDEFQTMLPTLRRTFAKFAPVERKKMLEMVKNGRIKSKATFHTDFDTERANIILPTLKLLLED